MSTDPRAHRAQIQRQRILDVLFSFGWLTLKELAFYTDLDPAVLLAHLDEGAEGLVPSGRVARRRRKGETKVFEYTVDPY